MKRALNFLTGDRWKIGFRSRPEKYSTIAKERNKTLIPAPFDNINLFSGGLDSLIGAVDSLQSGKTPLLVSHADEGVVSKSQEECFIALKEAYPGSQLNKLRSWIAIRKGLVDGVSDEITTRGRSFLFFSLGVIAGIGLDKKFVLNVPENGFIALNVPLDPLRLGALSTHTTHPFYMARWNELLEVLKINGELVNPYWDKTKREMVKKCSNPKLLKKITTSTLSCSSPTKHRWDKYLGHCGYCLPCLIRRAALNEDDLTEYFIQDLSSRRLNSLKSEGQQVRSFQLAFNRLNKNPDLAKLLIHKPGPLSDYPDRHQDYANVYHRGLKEVQNLLKNVKAAPS